MRRSVLAFVVPMLLAASAAAQPTQTNHWSGLRANLGPPASIAGAWNVAGFLPGRLSLTPGANGILTGTFDLGGGAPIDCHGQWQGPQFVILCAGVSGGTMVMTGIALTDPPVLAPANGTSGARPSQTHLKGKQNFAQFGLTSTDAPHFLAIDMTGSPAA